MAKLYAEITSDKDNKKISKGGNNKITIELFDGRSNIISIDYIRDLHELHIYDDTENLLTTINDIQA